MAIQKAQPALLAEQVHATLYAAILSGELPAGSRLTVRELAEQVGTSPMPVREALRRLEEAGMVESAPHRGAVVRALTPEELVHAYGIRRLLEVEAARLGAGRVSEEDCDRMQAEYELLCKAIGERRVVALMDHDEAMLAILYDAAGNPLLVKMIRDLWRQCRAYKLVGAQGSLEVTGDDTWGQYQQDVIAAARRRDPAAAAAVIDQSLVSAIERIKVGLEGRGATRTPGEEETHGL